MAENHQILPSQQITEQPLFERLLGLLDKSVKGAGHGLVAIAAVVIFALMMLTFTDVILRYIFDRPLAWSYELTRVFLLIIIFFGLAYVGIKKSHIRIDVVTSHLSEKARTILGLVVDPMSLFLFIFFAWRGLAQFNILIQSHQIFSNLKMPTYIVQIFLFLGCAVFCLVLAKDILSDFYKLFHTDKKLFALGLGLSIAVNAVLTLSPFWYQASGLSLSVSQIIILGLVLLFALMSMGITIGSGLALVGFVCVTYFTSLKASLNLIGTTPPEVAMNYTFSVIPLFVLMGMFAYHSKIIADLYHAASKWVGRLPGGLAVATLFGCAGFAAVCGSSVASSAAMSNIAYPELKKYGYDDGLSAGTIAAGGSVGTMIPPSMDFIIYGVLTLTSIGALLISGILPGILIILFFMATALIICFRKPEMGPPAKVNYSLSEKIKALPSVWPVLTLFLLVIGGIYFGIFTATEGASIGAFGALIIALIKKTMTWGKLYESLRDTAENGSMLLIILIGSMIFSYFLALTGVPTKLAGFLAALTVNRWLILAMILVIYLILGCIMDAFSIMIVTVPILFPTIVKLGFDPIWYGVLMVLTVEIGLLTPPFGVGAFVVSGTTKIPMSKVFKGLMPFVSADIAVLILLTAFPQISLILPSLMHMK